MPHQKLRPSFSFDEERIKQLKQIAPEAFADGKINWKVLQEALGDNLEEEGQDIEHFGLFWPGKREARRLAAIPSQGTLVPCPGEGVDEEKTRNIFIEGENLEVLKLLQKSYAGRIKMIYIDPPYNTGNDFVYDDDFKEPIEEYLRRTGQVDDEGKALTTNKKADGRFHSRWLSMMYPRLRLAKYLLRDDGVMFVSIDDNELHNLKQIMNEIFGDENFVAQFAWRRTDNQSNIGDVARVKEYVLCYARNKNTDFKFGKIQLSERAKKEYRYKDNKGQFRRLNLIDKTRGRHYYKVKTTKGKILDGPWILEEKELMDLINKDGVYWADSEIEQPYGKMYLNESEGQITSDWLDIDVGTNQQGSNELEALFGYRVFDFPKPISLIRHFITLCTNNNDIVLDFFAGTAVTAQAVMEHNLSDNGNRKYIVIQLPEKTNDKKYPTLADVAKKRITASLKKYSPKLKDNGFLSFKLDTSNYKRWTNYDGTDAKQLETQFEEYETPLKTGCKKKDLLVEIMLLEGFPLDSKTDKMKGLDKNKVEIVISDFCEHRLLVCLDDKIYADTAKELQYQENDIFICLDSALTDQLKLTLADKLLLKTI